MFTLLPHSLSDLGFIFNTEIRKLDFDHTRASNQTIYTKHFKEELLTYLNNDLLCLLEIIIKSNPYGVGVI